MDGIILINKPKNVTSRDVVNKLSKILNIIILNAVNHTNYGEVSLNVNSEQIDSANYEFTFLINQRKEKKFLNFKKKYYYFFLS